MVGVRSQGLVQTAEGRPVSDVTTPAPHHQLKQRGGTQWRRREIDLRERDRGQRFVSLFNGPHFHCCLKKNLATLQEKEKTFLTLPKVPLTRFQSE